VPAQRDGIYATQRDRECLLDLVAQANFRNSATGRWLQQASRPSTSRVWWNDCRLRVWPCQWKPGTLRPVRVQAMRYRSLAREPAGQRTAIRHGSLAAAGANIRRRCWHPCPLDRQPDPHACGVPSKPAHFRWGHWGQWGHRA